MSIRKQPSFLLNNCFLAMGEFCLFVLDVLEVPVGFVHHFEIGEGIIELGEDLLEIV